MKARILEKEKKRPDWDGKGFFIGEGYRWGVKEINGELRTICAGPVNEKPPDVAEALPTATEVVAKLPDKAIPHEDIVMQQKHAGGRPKKEGGVHRITKWRREKAEQGVLI